MSFRDWQPQYAASGIATFPVVVGPDGKKPLVSNYARFGLRASTEIAQKFPDAIALGLMVGKRNRLTVLDVDSSDECVLTDALGRHGQTPIVVRTGSGNRQAWYRYNGEERRIRPEPDKPIDILGGGFVVAPPSHGTKSNYQFIEGGLDDLDRLPVLHGLPPSIKREAPATLAVITPSITEGRNNTLFRHCMRAAHRCDDFYALLDVARTRNDELCPPLEDDEVVRVAASAWGYTERGENRFGHPGVYFDAKLADWLARSEQDALILLTFLRAHNKPDRVFMVANGLAKTLGWTEKRLAAARNRLLGVFLERVSLARQHCPAQYRWQLQGGQN